MQSSALHGLDSLLSTVQMPAGVPVATLAIGQAGATNAALLAVQIISLGDAELRARFKAYREEQSKKVLEVLLNEGGDPASIAAALGFEAMDSGALDTLVDELIANNPAEWQRYCDGDQKVTQFFVGQVMKATQGKADGKAVNAALAARKP